jgi:hypothetical protein
MEDKDMADTVVAVFSGKDYEEDMRGEGGSGHWLASSERVKEADFLLVVRNRRETWAKKDHEHGTAFLVGRGLGSKQSPYSGRIVITFKEYALIEVPDAWSKCTAGQRYPVAYLNRNNVESNLGIKFDQLEWLPYEGAEVEGEIEEDPPLTIAQAKRGLAKTFGVEEKAIEIIIRT